MSTKKESGPTYTVRTPLAVTGLRAGVMITDGVGHTDDPVKAEELRSMGYEVTEDAALAAASATTTHKKNAER